MVEVASEHGYGGATVARVIERAGVSRATFYAHFRDREECFMAAYEAKVEVVRGALRAVGDVAEAEQLPDTVLALLLGELAADPAAARLALIEAFALPAPARSAHEELLVEVVGVASRFLDRQGPKAPLQIPAAALVLGVGQILAARTVAGTAPDVERLHRGLARWIDSYRLPEGSGPLTQARWAELARFARLVAPRERDAALLPRGRSAMAEEAAADARRRRIFDAIAEIAARDGYAALTVARIAEAARIPRAAFYSHFEGKADAVLATQTHGLREAMALTAAEFAPATPWPRRVWNSLGAFLANVAEKPAYARLDFVESFAAGPAAIRHRQYNQMAFALFLEDGYRQNENAERLPRICSAAIGGAVFGLMRELVVEGRIDRMLSLRPAIAYTVLGPFIGPLQAANLVQGWAQGAP